MENLKSFVEKLSKEWNCKMQEFAPDRFSVDVPLVFNDGSARYQMVYINEYPAVDKPCYSLFSRIGSLSASTNVTGLLTESARYCYYGSVGIIQDNGVPGANASALWIISRPLIKHTSEELMKIILWEVAQNADYFEAHYFGGDAN